MNNLKFRAWHKENEEYWEVMSILFDTQELELYEWGNVRFDEVIMEQYTGLKDNDGKEIYDGDIIEFKDIYSDEYDEGSIDGYNIGRIWIHNVWGVCVQDLVNKDSYASDYPEEYFGADNIISVLNDCKVIGNIHENEELLNE